MKVPMPKDDITKPAVFTRSRQSNAIEKQPPTGPTAKELIVQAREARTALHRQEADISDRAAVAEQASTEGRGEEKSVAAPHERLPTMRQLKVAQQNLRNEIIAKEARRQSGPDLGRSLK